MRLEQIQQGGLTGWHRKTRRLLLEWFNNGERSNREPVNSDRWFSNTQVLRRYILLGEDCSNRRSSWSHRNWRSRYSTLNVCNYGQTLFLDKLRWYVRTAPTAGSHELNYNQWSRSSLWIFLKATPRLQKLDACINVTWITECGGCSDSRLPWTHKYTAEQLLFIQQIFISQKIALFGIRSYPFLDKLHWIGWYYITKLDNIICDVAGQLEVSSIYQCNSQLESARSTHVLVSSSQLDLSM